MGLKDFIGKNKKHRESQPRISLNKNIRWVIIVILYLVIFSLLDLLSHKFQLYPGVVAWYPPDGVSLAFLFTFGPGFTPIFALASIISSLVVYHLNTPIAPILVWALILSAVYWLNAFILRRRFSKDPQFKDTGYAIGLFVASAVITMLLAFISVINLVRFGEVPKSQLFDAAGQWWIGEMIGLLVFTPFMVLHVMPWIKRFTSGKKLSFPKRIVFHKSSLEQLGQVFSTLAALYLVFGVPALRQFHPYFLIALPLIWIAMSKGLSEVTKAIVLNNFGVMFAIWLFKFDRSLLADFQFLLFGIYFSVLLIGVIVTRQKASENELQQKEIHFQALTENATDAILLLNPDRSIKYESPSTQRILGYDPAEQERISPASLTHPDDEQALADLIAELIQTPTSVSSLQYRVRHFDGSWRWIESTFSNQLENPNINAIIVNFREITERKAAEETLQHSERRFRALVEQSQEEISLISADGILTYESPTTLRPLGYPPNALVGKSFFDLFHTDDRAEALQLFQTVAATPGMVKHASFKVRHHDGSWRWMEGFISNMLDDPAVKSIVLNYRDITSRKQAEEEITNLAKIPSESPNPMLRISKKGKLLYANPASVSVLNMWGIEVGEDLPDYMREIAVIAVARKENIPVEITCDEKVISIIVTPIIETGYINLYGSEITSLVNAEKNLKTSNEELSMLFELSHALAEANSLEAIFDIVNRHAVESVHNTFARIALLEEGKFVIRAAYPVRELGKDFCIGQRISVSSMPFAKRSLESNLPLVLQANDPKISPDEKELLFMGSAQTVCLIPLRISDSSSISEKLIGLLILDESRNAKRESFTSEKVRLARTIGDSAAVAIRRMLLRDQTERRMQQLVALSQIDLAIITNSDMQFRLSVVCFQVLDRLKVDAVGIWKFDPGSNSLELITGRGFKTSAFMNPKPIGLGEGEASRAALERRTIHISNLAAANNNPRFTKALAEEPFESYYAVPLIVSDEVEGVLEIFHRTSLEPNEDWMQFLQALANQAAIAIDNSTMFTELQQSNVELTQAYDATIQGWSRALDLRDNETEGHTQRVTELTMKLARLFGVSEEELVNIRRGALLHDIGKMGVPDRILLKPGPLTDEEWVIMRKHTTFAYDLLTPIAYLKPAIDIPYCHHEKWDGSGYPRGLAGEEIPFAARLFAVVDVWDALTSDRPYRAAWPEEKVFDHIKSMSGTHFDPQVVKICLEPGLLMGYPKNQSKKELWQWSEKFSVGVREMDIQHQKLIGFLNRLISVSGTTFIHSEMIKEILQEMTTYTRVHFVTEEKLMDDYKFPEFEEHKKSHQEFEAKTLELFSEVEKGSERTGEDLLTYLTDWLTHHILEEDMAYKEFFNEKGIR